jgi:hypothetical protein
VQKSRTVAFFANDVSYVLRLKESVSWQMS